jgi:hypothetical protein
LKPKNSLALTLSILITHNGCASSSSIVRFDSADPLRPHSTLDATQVGIYRTHGPYAVFAEIGLITLRSTVFDVPGIYERLRKDAAAQGAEAIIDLKIRSETHSETDSEQRCTPNTSCDANGQCTTANDCTTEWVTKDVTTYLSEGSMIRSKK